MPKSLPKVGDIYVGARTLLRLTVTHVERFGYYFIVRAEWDGIAACALIHPEMDDETMIIPQGWDGKPVFIGGHAWPALGFEIGAAGIGFHRWPFDQQKEYIKARLIEVGLMREEQPIDA